MGTNDIKGVSPRLLNIKKAAVYSGLPIWAIRTLIGNEQIQFLKIGNKYYLDVNDVEEFINANKTKTAVGT